MAIEDAPAPLDVHRIVDTLNRHGVDYVVIGGIAVLAHGNPRATFDLDLVASDAADNLRRLASALDQLGARVAGVDGEGATPSRPDGTPHL